MQYITKSAPTIEGALIIRPAEQGDNRQWLYDLEQQEQYTQMGLEEQFTIHTHQKEARGVVRGLYFQRKGSYSRLVGVTAGRALCVVVDLRPESKTFGAANSIELSAENQTMLYIPPYCAYGFLTLEAATEVVCNGAGEVDPASEAGIIFDDEIIAINWQYERYDIDERRLSISPRDKKFPSFRSYNQNTLWINRPKKSKYALSRRKDTEINR